MRRLRPACVLLATAACRVGGFRGTLSCVACARARARRRIRTARPARGAPRLRFAWLALPPLRPRLRAWWLGELPRPRGATAQARREASPCRGREAPSRATCISRVAAPARLAGAVAPMRTPRLARAATQRQRALTARGGLVVGMRTHGVAAGVLHDERCERGCAVDACRRRRAECARQACGVPAKPGAETPAARAAARDCEFNPRRKSVPPTARATLRAWNEPRRLARRGARAAMRAQRRPCVATNPASQQLTARCEAAQRCRPVEQLKAAAQCSHVRHRIDRHTERATA
jgi:hypothetical protein